jgi:hypothetical protein
MKIPATPIIYAAAIVLSAWFIKDAVIERNKANNSIEVTGLGEQDFTSDLIVWEGYFERENKDLKTAYTQIEQDRLNIEKYLQQKGISKESVVFNSVNTRENSRAIYSNQGQYVGQEFVGYILNQAVIIESKEVEKVEKLSREITELLQQGIPFYSLAPRYYYTQLADLKQQMIAQATEDAHTRAKNIAEKSGAILGDLQNAKMGIFQITGQNSGEDYTWGGAYNTAAKNKTASITMKLTYRVK